MDSSRDIVGINEKRDGLIDRNQAYHDARCQRLSLDQLHHEELLPVGFFQAVQRGDVRMIELGKERGFTLETIEALLVLGELLRQHFDGDVTAELRVPRSVNLSHSALTNGLDDFVVAEFRAG